MYRELQNCAGFGRVYYFGIHNSYNAMVMSLLGGSLEDLFTRCGRRFSLQTVLQIADHVLERMDTMHSRHLIHRDVKPANFVIGPGKNCQVVYCIDFGLSTRYRHPRTLQHIPYRESRSLTGTPRYASINNHLGVEQSRRDDLESIGYVLIYFLRGSLPWQGLKARNAKRKYKMILERKQAISVPQLCQGLPQQFAEYLSYCRNLKFEAKPNIGYLRGLFRELYKNKGFELNEKNLLEWDWTKFEDGSEEVAMDTGGDMGSPGPPLLPTGTRSPDMQSPVDMLEDPAMLQRAMTAGPGAGGGIRSALRGDDKVPQTYESQGGTASLSPAGQALHQPRGFHGEGTSELKQAAQQVQANKGRPAHASRKSGMGATGGWSMWNLRPKTSGTGFWGTGVSRWSLKDSGKQAHERRSSTADGAQAEWTRATSSGALNGPGEGRRPQTANAVQQDPHIVANARGVMRYRDDQGVTGPARSYAAQAAWATTSSSRRLSADSRGGGSAAEGGSASGHRRRESNRSHRSRDGMMRPSTSATGISTMRPGLYLTSGGAEGSISASSNGRQRSTTASAPRNSLGGPVIVSARTRQSTPADFNQPHQQPAFVKTTTF